MDYAESSILDVDTMTTKCYEIERMVWSFLFNYLKKRSVKKMTKFKWKKINFKKNR